MKNMTIWNIARACKGHLAVPAGKHTGTCPAAGMAVIRGYSGKEAAGIVIDSRKVEPGDIFVAIRGERVDGHQFIREVFDKARLRLCVKKNRKNCRVPASVWRTVWLRFGRSLRFTESRCQFRSLGSPEVSARPVQKNLLRQCLHRNTRHTRRRAISTTKSACR